MEYDLDASFLACHEAGVCDCDIECSTEEATEVGSRMRQLVFLVVPPVQRNVDALVIFAWNDSDASAGKLGTQLVISARGNAFFWAIHVPSRDWRVVRGLFGEVGYGDRLASSRAGAGDDVGLGFLPS